MENEIDFDIVVVGCGVTGTAAALSAAESAEELGKHVRVAVLERSDFNHRGGNSRWTDAYLRMKSVVDIADDFVDDMMNFSDGFSDRTYVETLAKNAGKTLQWVNEKGVKFDYLPTMFLTSSQPRLLPVGGGRAIVDTLARRAEGCGVQIVYETTAWQLLLDNQGAVEGLMVRVKGGGSLCLKTKSVILAAGGFEGNPEMMAQYIGRDAHRIPTIAEGGQANKGEAIRMALSIGAKGTGQWDLFHAEPVDPRSKRDEATVMTYPYAILVDQHGKRFVDEGISTADEQYEAVTRTIYFDLPGRIAYMISDQKMFKIPNYERALQTEQPPIEANTIEELAQQIGVPTENLVQTVRSYNEAIQPGEFRWDKKDDKKTVGLTPPKSNWAIPINDPPFIAFPVVCSIVFTYGGLFTDSDGRVLSSDDEAIPGLYAAGEITGLYYGKYPGATSVLRGLVFGRRAGIHAVSYVISR